MRTGQRLRRREECNRRFCFLSSYAAQVIRHLTYQAGKTANAKKTNDTDSAGTTRASLLQPFEKRVRRSKELVNSSL